MTTDKTPKSYRIPSMSAVRARLEKLSESDLKALARRSGVPFGTLTNIKYGKTTNPGIETVRSFFHKVDPHTTDGHSDDQGADS